MVGHVGSLSLRKACTGCLCEGTPSHLLPSCHAQQMLCIAAAELSAPELLRKLRRMEEVRLFTISGMKLPAWSV